MSLFLMAREPSVYRQVMTVMERVKRPYSVHFHSGSWELAQSLLAEGYFSVVLIEYEQLNSECRERLLASRKRIGFALVCLDTAYNLNRDRDSADMGATDYLALDSLKPSRLERTLYYANRVGLGLRELSTLAYQDGLSQLPNRMAFSERLQKLIDTRSGQKAQRQPFALLFIDLNRFKVINDTLGHKVGNEVIKIVAERIRRCLHFYGRHGFSARYAGDEFVVLLEQFSDKAEVVQWAHRLVDSISRTIHWHSHAFEVGCSIGISYFPDSAANLERLVDCADTAMYAAKKQSRRLDNLPKQAQTSTGGLEAKQYSSPHIHVREYTVSMDEQRRQDRAMENALRQALKRQEFCLLYQPRFRTCSPNALVCVEALLRWQHPERGLLAPKEFLSVAEKNDLIVVIGRWVVSQALRDWTAMKRVAGLEQLHLALNFSLNQLLDTGLIQDLQNALHNINAHDMQGIELEIREAAGLSQIDRIEKHLRFLAQMGARISLDDFGSGHASLMHLQRLPIHSIKFNNPQVKQISHVDSEESSKLIKALIGLAHGLGKQAIVEGVETGNQHKALMLSGCDFLQGFFYCQPLPSKTCLEWIKNYQQKNMSHNLFQMYCHTRFHEKVNFG